MSIYAIGDLHLSLTPGVDKPMDVFGHRWLNHVEKLEYNWKNTVKNEDTVLIPGDISWGINLQEAEADLEWIHQLPGQKIICKGNHDLWWMGITRLNKMYDNICFLQNTFTETEGYAICGSRGWILPGSEGFNQHDEKIYKRELLRMEMSLKAARDAACQKIICMMHFPPTNENHEPSEFTGLFEKYGVEQVVYGHIHGKDCFSRGLQAVFNGVDYRLVSLDYVDAKPVLLR